MGYKDITAGTKTAKPVAMRFIKSEGKGTPAIEISFEFEEESTGTTERLSYQAWLSDGARENSMATLIDVLGYNGSENTDANGVFTDPKVINYGKECALVIDMEEYNGKRFPKIKYVNQLGGSKFAGASPEVVKSELASVGFKGLFLAHKSKTGQAPASAAKNATGPAGKRSDKDLPI